MFSEMITALQAGKMPGTSSLHQRLRGALIKKAAIIRQPSPLWPRDPKINPPSAHLLWAAVILRDRGNFNLAADLMVLETLESSRQKNLADIAGQRERLIARELQELRQLIGDRSLQEKINESIKSVHPATL
ncbi:MAG: hypothetical protein BM485_08825 [Desulfobulbaceae bacterium DB1]|nr:MAG: hypothetical protein BM485_08825 [Desulfobulbaceae bacterium DB1]